MKIIKRNGCEVPYDCEKIHAAITAANAEVDDKISDTVIGFIVGNVEKRCSALARPVHVEEVQDMVLDELDKAEAYKLARHYSEYRLLHEQQRRMNTTDGKILSLLERNNEEAKQENANKNPIINSTLRDYMAGEVSRDICRRFLFPADVIAAHDEGIIHVHDLDYIAEPMHNCCLVNLADMLQNGTVVSGTMIEKPHSFSTACNIATQIIAQVASNQYGGQTISLAHLASFVDVSRQKIRGEVFEDVNCDCGAKLSEAELDHIVEKRVRREVKRGLQTIQYQINTLLTTNGQTPFVTVFMYLDEVPEGQTRDDLALIIEETLLQRIEGVKNEKGVWITPAFPKLIYVLDEDNIQPGTKYYYLTELAAKCTAKRMVPDYISAKVMKQLKGDVYACMGCRSFLTPSADHKYYGRFNQGVVTINLVDVACSADADGDENKFWQLLNERCELCRKALMCRHERLKGTPSDVAPILWQNGALARLKDGEVIDDLLYNNYSTISLGYAGIAEIAFVQYSLMPWIIRIEKGIIKDLLLEEEQDVYFPKFNVDGLMRGDYQSRMNAYAIGVGNGFMSPNDVRRLENMDLIPHDLGGDDYYLNGSYNKLQDAGAAYDLDEPEQTDTEEQDEPDEESTDDRFLRKRRRKKVRNGGM